MKYIYLLGSHVVLKIAKLESKKYTGTRQTKESTIVNDKTLFGRVQVGGSRTFQMAVLYHVTTSRMRPISFALYCARKKIYNRHATVVSP